jgi:hypothetical protein
VLERARSSVMLLRKSFRVLRRDECIDLNHHQTMNWSRECQWVTTARGGNIGSDATHPHPEPGAHATHRPAGRRPRQSTHDRQAAASLRSSPRKSPSSRAAGPSLAPSSIPSRAAAPGFCSSPAADRPIAIGTVPCCPGRTAADGSWPKRWRRAA